MAPTLISRRVFQLSWLLLVSLHVAVGLYMYAVARLHTFVLSQPNLEVHIGYLGDDNLISYFPAVIVISWVSVAAHSLMLLTILRYSVRARGFALSRPEIMSIQVRPIAMGATKSQSCWATLCDWSHRIHERIAIQENELELLVEIALQTYQTNKLSQLVATVWVNRLMVAVLVANCWFRPLINRVLKHRQPFVVRQLICLAIDTLLDIAYGLAIPLVILYPYWRDIVPPHYAFPFVFYYKDEWYVKAIAENRQLVVTSWVDFASKSTPAFSLAFRLRSVQRLLVKCMKQTPALTDQTTLGLIEGVVPTNTKSLYDSQVTTKITTSGRRQRKAFHAVLGVWGLVVVALHLHATTIGLRGAERGCLLELRPWLSTGYTCVVLEVSCSQRQLSGHREEMQQALTRIQPSSLSVLVVSSCPELHIPSEIQRFPRLMMLKIYNSSIVDWPTTAALTETTHPNMQLLYITRTNMTSIPDGLQSRDFPTSLYDIEISDTNLSALPEDIDEAWASSLSYLFLELAPAITSIPTVISRLLQLQVVSLASNSIADIDDSLLENNTFYQLALNYNPLQRIPETIGLLDIMKELKITGTLVSELPASWMLTDTTAGWPTHGRKTPIQVDLRGSPMCEQLLAANETLQESTGHTSTVGGFAVFCVASSPLYRHYYPLEAEDEWRRTNQ